MLNRVFKYLTYDITATEFLSQVLGIKEGIDHSAPVDSNDVEEERQKRASTMIKGAMKDLEGLQLSVTESSSVCESQNSSLFSEVSSSVENTPIITPRKVDNSTTTETSPLSNSAARQNDNLLITFDGMETGEVKEILTPQKINPPEQEQKLSLLDLSPTPNSGTFGFERSRNSDPFFQNKAATLGHLSEKASLGTVDKAASLKVKLDPTQNASQRTSCVSNGSLVSGLNAILQQQPHTFESSLGLNKDDPFEIKESEEDNFQDSVELAEDAILNEGMTDESDSSEDSRENAGTQVVGKKAGSDSVFGDAEVVNLSQGEWLETPPRKSPTKGFISCMVDTKSETMKQMRKEMAELEKRERKKTSGAWFKGKIATGKEKIKSVKKRTRSDGQALRKMDQQKNVRKLTQPQSQLKRDRDCGAVQESTPKKPVEPQKGTNRRISL